MEKGPGSAWRDWFFVNRWPVEEGRTDDGRYFSFSFHGGMPKLNTNHPAVQDYLIGLCEDWVRRHDIDGLRFDVGNEISHAFLRRLRVRLKALKPDLYLLGEIWHDAPAWLEGDEYDAVMHYPLQSAVRRFFEDESLPARAFGWQAGRCLAAYAPQVSAAQFTLLDSHDTIRLRSRVRSEDEFWQQLAALFTLPLGAAANAVILTLLWCLVQIGYVMLSAPIAAAFGERIPDKFRSRADAYRGIGLTVGQLLGAVVAVLLIRTPSVAIRLCAACFVVAAVVVVLVLPRERSSVELRSRAIERHEFFSHYQMPKGAPNFVRVLVARLVMTAGVSLTGVFLWYIVLYAVNGGDVDAAVPVMAAVAVASFVGGLIATLVLGPVADHWEDGRIPSVLACGLYIVGLAVPCVAPSAAGVIAYALLSGCAYVIFDGISQRQAAAVLPDIRMAGRNLAVLNLASQVGVIVGALLGALALFVVGTYQVLFPVAIVAVIVAAAVIWSIHEDQGR